MRKDRFEETPAATRDRGGDDMRVNVSPSSRPSGSEAERSDAAKRESLDPSFGTCGAMDLSSRALRALGGDDSLMLARGDGADRIHRREFLRRFGGTATVAAASTATLARNALADTETNNERRKPRYRETEHVKTYYRLNRYPS